MAVELAEIAAGLPFAASLAMASGLTALREGRRRSTLNRAMHELRRPLQALALSLPPGSRGDEAAESALRMAAAAADRLDREINGEETRELAGPVPVKPLVEAALARWRPRAAAEGRSLALSWKAADPVVLGDETGLAQALDNLISNGFEHGRGKVAITVREERGWLRLAVRDEGGGGLPRPVPDSGRPVGRHGHGLKIVRGVAARHGGSFRLRRSPSGAEARLDLPLAGGR